MPDSLTPENAEQTALACYLSAVVAIGNCMAEVCPPVGTMYRDRLLKLPRRLGFDATPHALIQSREAVETDLKEFASTASAWVHAGSTHAARLMEHLESTEDTLSASADLQRAFLEDLAEHIEASAEVDDEAQLRISFKRYAAGLRAYSRRARTEKLATIDDLRRRREEVEFWLAEGSFSDYVDHETGLLNRAAAERRLQTEIGKQKAFCVILVGWTLDGPVPEDVKNAGAGQIARQLAERLAATIRPYDVIFRWSGSRLVTVFEAPEAGISSRATQIGGWLGEGTFAVEIDGVASMVTTHTLVSVVEHADGEPVEQLVGRVESVSQEAPASLAR